MDRKIVYVETSIVSYLTARPTGDLLAAAWQKITADWWETQRQRFELCASEVKVGEAGRGDAEALVRELAQVDLLPVTAAADELAEALVRVGAVPATAANAALDVAVAAVHGVDYLLTWNCRHLHSAEARPVIQRICRECGYAAPEICTPQELMGGADMADEIIEKVWRIKDEIAREHGYDVGRLGAYYRRFTNLI